MFFPEPGAVVIFYQPPIVCVGECVYLRMRVCKASRAFAGNGKGLCEHPKMTEKDSGLSLNPRLKPGEVLADLTLII